MGEVDRMFDDLDSVSHVDVLPLSILLEDSDADKKLGDTKGSPVRQALEEIALHPVPRSPSPELVIGHMPVKTSSPIDENMSVEVPQGEDEGKGQELSPILLVCEEVATTEPEPIKEPQYNGHVTENDDCELESPPSKVILNKPKSSHRSNEDGTDSKESSPPVSEKETQNPVTAASEGPNKTLSSDCHPAPEKNAENVGFETSTHVGKDLTTFLQKLRDDVQPKPTVSRKLVSPVKVSPLPAEPEDDFLILEDNSPLWFSIPSKTTTRQKKSKTSSSDKDSSTDREMKDSSPETAEKQPEAHQASDKHRTQTVDQRKKHQKVIEENQLTGNVEDEQVLLPPEDPPTFSLMESDKPNRKKRLKKNTKESNTTKYEIKETASNDKSQKPEWSSEEEVRRSVPSKRGKGSAKNSRAKSLKSSRKEKQGSDGVKDTAAVEDVKTQSQEPSSEELKDVEEPDSLPGARQKSEVQLTKSLAKRQTKQNKLSASLEGSLSEDGQALGKRKRNPPGEWWLSCPQSAEEKVVADDQCVMKKSKQVQKELSSSTAVSSSPVKPTNILKRTKLTSSQKTKKKKSKLNKEKAASGHVPDEIKTTAKEVNTVVAEEIQGQEQQLELLDKVPDPELSGPFEFSLRDHSLVSEEKIFQKVYSHSSKKMSRKLVSARGDPDQLKTPQEGEKRRRRPPGSWWKVDNMSEAPDLNSYPPRKLHRTKPLKDRKKRSTGRPTQNWTRTSGSTEVLSTPVGGAVVSPLTRRPIEVPKSVKSCISTFKDIFTSNAASPTVIISQEADRINASVCPAEVAHRTPRQTSKDLVSESRQDNKCPLQNSLTVLQSGPSSMIDLEDHEDPCLPSSRVAHASLSMLDLCAPPLKPLILQEKDKDNLTEWLKSLWPSPVNSGAEITPDQFDWYTHQGRAMGVTEELHCGSICNGKMLLGSYMKKPLWVDHSATTVFNLLTSSVSANIDCTESHFYPGQSFMVPCGHAYSIQNLTAQPAVLYFTRVQAESPD
ncbi:uncharacterized protein ACBR49_016704 [Aulostomus maculatus]